MIGKSYYSILEIEADSTESEIKKSYRSLALKWHPDKNPNNVDAANEKFKIISAAYEALMDLEQKSKHDILLKKERRVIFVRMINKIQMRCAMQKNTALERMFKGVTEKWALKKRFVAFFDGRLLTGWLTPERLGMMDCAHIDLFFCPFDETPLMVAASNNYYEICNSMLKNDSLVQIDFQCKDGNTALILAATEGHFPLCKLLIGFKAKMDIKNNNGETALMLAAGNGHMSVCTLLLTKGAAIDIISNTGTALIHAVVAGYFETCKLLIEKGALIETALLSAAAWEEWKICTYLIGQGADVNIIDIYGNTAMIYAATGGNVETFQLLMERGADINFMNNGNTTALMYAATGDHFEISRLLIERNAWIDIQDEEDSTALLIAAAKGYWKLCALLIGHDADVNIKNIEGNTAMIYTAIAGDVATCRLLIENGADINITYNEGFSALMKASRSGHLSICKLLVDNGADLSIKNNDNKTAFDLAVSRDIREYLKKAGEMLVSSAKDGNLEKVKHYLDSNVNIDMIDSSSSTALMKASQHGHLTVCEFLLARGAGTEIQNTFGSTALQIAAKEGRSEICLLLIEKGAAVDTQNNWGKTALMQAATDDNKSICELLIENDAGIDIQDKSGQTAIILAAEKGNLIICQFLIEKEASLDIKDNNGRSSLDLAKKKVCKEFFKRIYAERERPALEEAEANAAIEREQADIAAKFAASEALRLQEERRLAVEAQAEKEAKAKAAREREQAANEALRVEEEHRLALVAEEKARRSSERQEERLKRERERKLDMAAKAKEVVARRREQAQANERLRVEAERLRSEEECFLAAAAPAVAAVEAAAVWAIAASEREQTQATERLRVERDRRVAIEVEANAASERQQQAEIERLRLQEEASERHRASNERSRLQQEAAEMSRLQEEEALANVLMRETVTNNTANNHNVTARVNSQTSQKRKPVCSFFLQGRCRKGNDCKFHHPEQLDANDLGRIAQQATSDHENTVSPQAMRDQEQMATFSTRLGKNAERRARKDGRERVLQIEQQRVQAATEIKEPPVSRISVLLAEAAARRENLAANDRNGIPQPPSINQLGRHWGAVPLGGTEYVTRPIVQEHVSTHIEQEIVGNRERTISPITESQISQDEIVPSETAVTPLTTMEEITQASTLLAFKVQAAMSNGTPVNLPFSILSEWTDHFEIEIGKGAFGSVFKGTVVLDGQQEIQVAVKKVNAEGICASLLVDGVEGGRGGRAFIQAIQREINVLSAFHHPNIIRLIGYCLPPIEEVRASEQRMKELCLVYELAPLGGLNMVLKNDEIASQLTWKDRLDIAIGISRGLSCLHNVVPGCPAFHRDVKAANVALMADFTPKIIDCGLSKYVPDGGGVGMSNLSSMGTRFGTPGYICSNYTRKPVPYDAKCEVFSFGIVLLELFTGLLQNYVDESGQPILLEETLEDYGTLAADVLAGEWPEECQEEYLQLARECTARYSKRIDKMMDVMQRLVAIRNKHIVPTSFEASLLAKNQALIAQVEALQLHNEIKGRGEREFKCECCFDDRVGVSKGVLCSNTDNPHFICGSANTDCFSAMVTAQANDNVAFKKNGSYIICAYCTALDHDIVTPFGSAQVTKHANGPALTAFKRAVSDAVFTAPVCVLCLDNPKEIILLPCFHKTYCVTCFEDPSVKNQRDCPYCRKRITGSGRVFE